MQLKVCNPHLSFFDFVSLDEGCDEMLCSSDRCKFIKGFESQRDSRCYFIATRKLKTEGRESNSSLFTWTMTQLFSRIFTVQCFFFLLKICFSFKHELHYIPPWAKLYLCLETNSVTTRFPASWNNLTKNLYQLAWIKWHISRFKIPAFLTCTLLPSPPPLPFVFFDTCTPISIFQPLRRKEKQPNVCLTKPFFTTRLSEPLWKKTRQKKQQTDSILSSMLTLSSSHNNYQSLCLGNRCDNAATCIYESCCQSAFGAIKMIKMSFYERT